MMFLPGKAEEKKSAPKSTKKKQVEESDTEEEVETEADLDFLPDEFSQLLQGRKKDEQQVRNFKTEGNFVHQSIHTSDPLCKFSKDCMHQTQVI